MFHPPHDHTCCANHAVSLDDRLADALRRCQDNGVRLTAQRRTVLELLSASNKALGAYDIMELLTQRTGKRIAPITIYRALDFLLEQKLIHRLESRNAYLACPHAADSHDMAVFMICETCGHVDEATSGDLEQQLTALASQHGFRPRGQIIEMAGRCAGCTDKA